MALIPDNVYQSMNGALKTLWRDKATITAKELKKAKAIGSDSPEKEPKTIATDVPCKISREGYTAPADGEYLAKEYDALVFMDNSVIVPPGAYFDITDVNGVVTRYKRASGTYPSYQSHQEIAVVFDERK